MSDIENARARLFVSITRPPIDTINGPACVVRVADLAAVLADHRRLAARPELPREYPDNQGLTL